jgi:hypothetical protein
MGLEASRDRMNLSFLRPPDAKSPSSQGHLGACSPRTVPGPLLPMN